MAVKLISDPEVVLTAFGVPQAVSISLRAKGVKVRKIAGSIEFWYQNQKVHAVTGWPAWLKAVYTDPPDALPKGAVDFKAKVVKAAHEIEAKDLTNLMLLHDLAKTKAAADAKAAAEAAAKKSFLGTETGSLPPASQKVEGSAPPSSPKSILDIPNPSKSIFDPVPLTQAQSMYQKVSGTSATYCLVGITTNGLKIAARRSAGSLSVRVEGSLATYKNRLDGLGFKPGTGYRSVHLQVGEYGARALGAILGGLDTEFVTPLPVFGKVVSS